VFDKVRVLAGMDGAVFGSAFGVNYYMPRNNNTYNVELSNVEFEELSFVSSARAINAITLSFTNSNAINSTINIGNGYPFIFGESFTFDGWRASDQQINIGYSSYFPQFNYGLWENTAPTYVNGLEYINPSGFFTFPGLLEIIQLGDASTMYAQATGAWTSNASVYKIDATILGADKVRPYECIKFDNTVPLRYQGKHFRPTSLSYDLKADKVKVTAYQIDTFPFDAGGNIDINLCDINPFLVEGYTWLGTSQENVCENGVNSATVYTWEGVAQENVCENGNEIAQGGTGSNISGDSVFDSLNTATFNTVNS
jgi:hypothetical protein